MKKLVNNTVTALKKHPVLLVCAIVVCLLCVFFLNNRPTDDITGEAQPDVLAVSQPPLSEADDETHTPDKPIETPDDIKDNTDTTETSNNENQLPQVPESALLSRSIPDNDYLIKSITPEKTQGTTVKPDTAFALITKHDMEVNELKPLLSLEPTIAFDITKTADSAFTLKTASALPADSIVKITLNDEDGAPARRFAFQTEGVFKITSTLPRDKSTYVPVNTGIEITFSYETGDISDYFEITPAASGSFKKQRNTVAFVPSSPLAEDTVYTITIKEGLPSVNGAKLQGDTVFRFSTNYNYSNYKYFVIYGGLCETFIKGDTYLIETHVSKEMKNTPVDVSLYQYDSPASYINAVEGYIKDRTWGTEYKFATSSLTRVYSSSDNLLSIDDEYYTPSFLMLPDNLDNGYYLADMTINYDGRAYNAQYLFQINPVSVYAGVLPNEAVFFINDAETGIPASAARITVTLNGESYETKTNEDGAATLALAAKDRGEAVLSVEYRAHTYVDILNIRQASAENYYPPEDYFLYLYTDREQYLTTDTVSVWGVVIPRKKSAPPPGNLTLDLRHGYYYYYDDYYDDYYSDYNSEGAKLLSVPARLSPDGTFTAKFTYEAFESGWGYSLTLRAGDTIMTSKDIYVSDYVKPTYALETEVPFYAWMPHLEPVKVTASASFFEGTAAGDVVFNFSSGGSSSVKPETVPANQEGYAEAFVSSESYDTWYPRSVSIYFRFEGVENEYQYDYKSFYALCRDVMLESEFKDKTLNIKTSMVDASGFTSDAVSRIYDYDYEYNYGSSEYGGKSYADILRGSPVDTDIKGTLKREWFTKEQRGSYYSFITKQTEYRYTYKQHEETVGRYTVSTNNGKVAFTDLPLDKPDSYYYMELEWKDTYGQTVKQTKYLNDYAYRWDAPDTHNYYFKAAHSFTDDEDITFTLTDNGDTVTQTGGTILFTVSGSRFITVNVKGSNTFTHTMRDEYIPNVNISGAYFDGRHVFAIPGSMYRFNPQLREIVLEVSNDAERYAPGGKAAVTVTARDKNGRAVSGAAVSLSVVDEAAFAVMEQNVNTLTSMYKTIYYPYVAQHASYREHSLMGDGGAERGDGDDAGGIRKDFRDLAAFLTGTTDDSGAAYFNIPFPDNITSWRVTAQVIGENADGKLCAGNTKTPLIVTKPLFLTVISLPQYIEGDDISVSARCNGAAALLKDTPITARIKGGGVDMTRTGISDTPLIFGKLKKGSYILTVSAEEGRARDIIELPLEVTESLLEVQAMDDFILNDGPMRIESLRWPISLYFYDNGNKLYKDVLDELYWSFGNRADLRAAREFARMEFGLIDADEFAESLSDLRGLVPLLPLPFSAGDYNLTALLCASLPEIISADTAGAFYDKLNKSNASPNEITSCYLGLAALSEPVLMEIISLLEDPGWLSASDKLRLCAALALLGDEDNALKHYLEITGDNGIVIYTDEHTKTQMARVLLTEINPGRSDIIENTSLALLTASVLRLPEAPSMVRFLLSEKTMLQTIALELITYYRHYLPEIRINASFSYTMDGKAQTTELNLFRGVKLKLTKEQFENADFKVLSGDVGCTVNYIGPLRREEGGSSIGVTKSYKSIKGGFKPGALIEVTISAQPVTRYIPGRVGFTYISYSFEDCIPSGARYYKNGERGYTRREGQRVSGYLNWETGAATYYIRLVSPGEFVSESAAVADRYGGTGYSERSILKVTP